MLLGLYGNMKEMLLYSYIVYTNTKIIQRVYKVSIALLWTNTNIVSLFVSRLMSVWWKAGSVTIHLQVYFMVSNVNTETGFNPERANKTIQRFY